MTSREKLLIPKEMVLQTWCLKNSSDWHTYTGCKHVWLVSCASRNSCELGIFKAAKDPKWAVRHNSYRQKCDKMNYFYQNLWYVFVVEHSFYAKHFTCISFYLKSVKPHEVCTIILPSFTWGLMLNGFFRVAGPGFGSCLVWNKEHAFTSDPVLLPSWTTHELAPNEMI